MIVQCTACEMRYHLDEDVLGSKGCHVRCTSCRHVWHQRPPAPSPYALVPVIHYPLAVLNEEKPARSRRAIGVILAICVLFVAGASFFVLKRDRVSEWLPYDLAVFLEGQRKTLALENFSYRKTVKGVVCQGVLHNTSSSMRYAPALVFNVFNNGRVVKKISYKLSNVVLLPGEDRPFYVELKSMPSQFSTIEVASH